MVVVAGIGGGEGGRGGREEWRGRREAGHALALDTLPLPGGDHVLPELRRSVSAMNLIVETAGVTHSLVLLDPAPQRRRASVAVVAGGAFGDSLAGAEPGCVGAGQGAVRTVHLMVETAGVTEVVTGGVSAPQRGRRHTTVDTLTRGRGGVGGRGGGGGGRFGSGGGVVKVLLAGVGVGSGAVGGVGG